MFSLHVDPDLVILFEKLTAELPDYNMKIVV